MNIIIDLIRKKNEHHVFNSETIKALESITTDNHYYLDVNSSSMDFIHNKKNITNINVNSSKLYFWLHSSLMLIRILLSNKGNNIILLSSTPLQYLICSIISKYTNININIFMHGELGYLNSTDNIGQKIGSFLINKVFSSKSKVKFIAINKYIFNRLSELYSKNEFLYIDHPLQQFDISRDTIVTNKDNIKIGAFGIQSKDKNSDRIYELVSLLDDKVFNIISFRTVGITDGSFTYDCNKNIKHYCKGHLNSSLIPKNEFIKNVMELDFALFFSDDDAKYDLVPSGVFSDCIALGIPIIAIRNKKLEFFFNECGNIGYLCDDISHLVDVISNMSVNDKFDFKKNILEVKKVLLKDKYSNHLKDILMK